MEFLLRRLELDLSDGQSGGGLRAQASKLCAAPLDACFQGGDDLACDDLVAALKQDGLEKPRRLCTDLYAAVGKDDAIEGLGGIGGGCNGALLRRRAKNCQGG